MAYKKVTAETLGAEIKKILADYEGDINRNMHEVTRKVAQKGVTAIRNESKATFKTEHDYKYAKGWRSDIDEQRLSVHATIYNGTAPGLPHLLENGHANRGGGRTPGRPHIAPVEEQLIREFEHRVEITIT